MLTRAGRYDSVAQKLRVQVVSRQLINDCVEGKILGHACKIWSKISVDLVN